ncbi:MAG: response regulator transcription factor [Deltaproteobacteria bacterium]|nr:response regulator transcription factor [Deltaproteobacteria bacterium]
MSKYILVVEDDPPIAQLLKYNLQQEKYDAECVVSGEEGLSLLTQKTPELIILDIMLPGMSGLDMCRAIKSEPKTSHIPIIMLTAKDEEIDKIVGLEMGADDYMTKPFSTRELVLRVRAILKRCAGGLQQKSELVFKDLKLNTTNHSVSLLRQKLDLTLTEYKLLLLFLSHPDKTFSRDGLLSRVWGYESDVFSRTVDTHITRLRSKLRSYGKHLVSERSVGYRWEGET